MEKELNWAVIGTGVIANEMAQSLQKMDKTLYGVANRTQTKAIDFAKKYRKQDSTSDMPATDGKMIYDFAIEAAKLKLK